VSFSVIVKIVRPSDSVVLVITKGPKEANVMLGSISDATITGIGIGQVRERIRPFFLSVAATFVFFLSVTDTFAGLQSQKNKLSPICTAASNGDCFACRRPTQAVTAQTCDGGALSPLYPQEQTFALRWLAWTRNALPNAV
jgi:hypothetical protein